MSYDPELIKDFDNDLCTIRHNFNREMETSNDIEPEVYLRPSRVANRH